MNEKSIKYPKLRGRIVECYGSCEKFRKELGISKTTMSKKMTGKSGISQKEVIQWSQMLGIDLSEVGSYFFA